MADYQGVDMVKPNAENYELAREKIHTGQWVADPIAGHILGVRRRPFARSTADGYIEIKFRVPGGERTVMAHRVMWEAEHGPLADGLEINHVDGCKSNNKLANLEPASHTENMHHAMAAGLTPRTPGSRPDYLTEDQARTIYTRAWAGDSPNAIAADFDVSRGTVSRIKHGHGWSHATGHARQVAQ